ncbi:MAG: 30S ribosomal protein S16, partial [Verrucomicrobiota bacterium]|nr:30S ribosomal protein S16 [Verrucomicrobiota bacterium]
MALKIRLQRHGASHRPFYRMVVTEAAARRDGRFVEVLGTYEPQASKPENELKVKLERVDYWKSVGAKATDTAASLIRQARRAPVEPIVEASDPEKAAKPKKAAKKAVKKAAKKAVKKANEPVEDVKAEAAETEAAEPEASEPEAAEPEAAEPEAAEPEASEPEAAEP